MGRITRSALGVLVSLAAAAHVGCEGPEDDAGEPPALPIEVVEGDQPLVADYEIFGAVRGELWADEEVGRRPVGVDVHRGIVTLTGTVNDLAAKRRAVAQAEAVPGVRAVIDRLVIVPRPYVERRRLGGAAPGDALVAEAVRDAWRQDERLSPFGLRVRVDEGVAWLTGRVDLAATRSFAEEGARNTVGVVAVENLIEVDDEAVAEVGSRRGAP